MALREMAFGMATREQHEKIARFFLLALITCVIVAASSAMMTYSYPTTIKPIMGPMILVHDVSGDLALAITGFYLINHLQKTWKMKRATVSRYTGLGVVGIWLVGGGIGIYGQFVPLVQGTFIWGLHFWTCLASIIIVCFHGAWAYRPRKKGEPIGGEEPAAS